MAQPRAGDRKTRPTGPVAPGFRWFWTGRDGLGGRRSGLVRPAGRAGGVLEPGGGCCSRSPPVIRRWSTRRRTTSRRRPTPRLHLRRPHGSAGPPGTHRCTAMTDANLLGRVPDLRPVPSAVLTVRRLQSSARSRRIAPQLLASSCSSWRHVSRSAAHSEAGRERDGAGRRTRYTAVFSVTSTYVSYRQHFRWSAKRSAEGADQCRILTVSSQDPARLAPVHDSSSETSRTTSSQRGISWAGWSPCRSRRQGSRPRARRRRPAGRRGGSCGAACAAPGSAARPGRPLGVVEVEVGARDLGRPSDRRTLCPSLRTTVPSASAPRAAAAACP